MKIVIFAGGSGRRLWPISRVASPKQFEPIIGDRSTLELAVDRVLDRYGAENIFVSSNERYLSLIRQQLPMLPPENLIGEPARRDLAAAVGLAILHVQRRATPGDPLAILWGDNYMTDVATFLHVLETAQSLIRQKAGEIIFVGETPRFANENLGWIGLGQQIGERDGRPYFRLRSFAYRPAPDDCRRMFASGDYVWNTGYFVTTPGYIRSLYQSHQPAMWEQLTQIESVLGQPGYNTVLQAVYPQMASVHFDDAILRNIVHDQALVLHGRMGWSDPGTLYALKEAINPDPTANVSHGLVATKETQDCLLYNYESNKLLAAVGLTGMIVVNTRDAVLVVPKDQIPLVKALVDDLVGTELEPFT